MASGGIVQGFKSLDTLSSDLYSTFMIHANPVSFYGTGRGLPQSPCTMGFER